METVIVTGAAGGIGRATLDKLARPGRRLICVDLDEVSLAAAAADLPGPSQAMVSDLAGPEACRDLIGRIGGPVAGLVHLVGIVEHDPVINEDPGSWDRVIGANLKNAYDLVGAMIGSLGNGDRPAKLVFASSLAYRRGSPEFIAYGAAKGGIAGLVRSLARRLGGDATVNAVAPGIIVTRMTDDLIANHGDRLLSGIALGRFGQPSDVADVISFLVDPQSDYVTGQVLNVDGGMAYN